MGSFLTNWKTSGSGALSILIGIGSLFGVKYGAGMSADQALALIVAGFGLLFAKDSNVTGGTTPQ